MATRKLGKVVPSAVKKGNGAVVPRYFLSSSWGQRLESFIATRPSSEGRDFAAANSSRIKEHLSLDKSLRVVFNLGGYALLNYLRSGDYQNIYEQPRIAGERRAPSQTRLAADELVNLRPARDFYFCALASGGTGIRYYGEYCAVLKPAVTLRRVDKILDRNSYDLLTPPLSAYLSEMRGRGKPSQLIDGLMSHLGDGTTQQMLAAKVLQRTPDSPRLLTAGAVANAILSDEDYCEAYHHGKIAIDTLEEIREHPADVSREGEILQRLEGGDPSAPRRWRTAALRRVGLGMETPPDSKQAAILWHAAEHVGG